MTTISDRTAPGDARSAGITVQELLAHDSAPVPAALKEESYVHLGDDDIPVERYTSRAWHDLEVERLWRKVWQVACRDEDIPNVGDHIVYELADLSAIVVRTADNTIKAFYNSCLHRGTQLREQGGCVPEFRCPFHGFTWKLDGSLHAIPCEWDFPHIDREKWCLPEFKVATWGGWVFVNPDTTAAPLEEHLGEFGAKFPWRHDLRYKSAHVAKILRCNWKVALEAFIESFHVIATHPQLLPSIGDANTQYDVWPGEPRFNRMITAMAVQSPHLPTELTEQEIADAMISVYTGAPGFPLPDGLTARQAMANMMRAMAGAVGEDMPSDSEALDAIEYYVFPNFVPWGGYSTINYRFRPNGNNPDECIMDVMFLSGYDPAEERPAPAPVHHLGPDDDWSLAPELGILTSIFNQDTSNLARIQRGLHATAKPGVTLGNYQEIRIRHYHQELTRWLQPS